MTSLRVRLYDLRSIRALRTVAALRGTGYRVPAIRDILSSLDDLATRTVALLEAGADIRAKAVRFSTLDAICRVLDWRPPVGIHFILEVS